MPEKLLASQLKEFCGGLKGNNNKFSKFKVTHQTPSLALFYEFIFWMDVHTDKRMYVSTDTTCKMNDHLFGAWWLLSQQQQIWQISSASPGMAYHWFIVGTDAANWRTLVKLMIQQ